MYIYNTTFAIDQSLEVEFLQWLRNEYILKSTEDGEYFNSPEIFVVQAKQEPQVKSFAVHMRAKCKDDIDRWYEDHGSRMFDEFMKRWNGRAVYFCTTLEAVE